MLTSKIFAQPKPIIGMVHLPPSPGQLQSREQLDLTELISKVKKDLDALQSGGVDGLLFCNESDLPYTIKVGHEVSAWTAFLIGSIYPHLDRPFGVNLLWDPIASIETAAAVGAHFVREVMSGSFFSEMGVLQPDPAEIARTRTRLRAENIALFTNIVPEFATAQGDRTVQQRAKAAAYFGFDALLVSGPIAGIPFAVQDLKDAKSNSGNVPVFANTGVNQSNVVETLKMCDGAIVGSSLKFEGKTFAPVDTSRVKDFMQLVKSVR